MLLTEDAKSSEFNSEYAEIEYILLNVLLFQIITWNVFSSTPTKCPPH